MVCLQVLLPARVGHLLDVDAGRGYSLIGQLLSESSLYHVLDEREPAVNVDPLPKDVLGTRHPHTARSVNIILVIYVYTITIEFLKSLK